MKQQLIDALIKEYSKILSIDIQIDTGDGWYWLIDKLCFFLQFNMDHNDRSQLQILHVQQKFGGLHFYTTKPNNSQRAQIDFTEFISYCICEKCGTTKDVEFNNDFVRTLCHNCTDLVYQSTYSSSFSKT